MRVANWLHGRQRIRIKRWKKRKKTFLNLLPALAPMHQKPGRLLPAKRHWINWYLKISHPANSKYPGIIFKPERDPGNQILNVQKLTKSIDGRMLFNNVNFDIVKGQKIAFLSKDPVALTSFFEIINNRMKPDSGKFEWGTTITTAYLPNDNTEFFTGNLTLMDWLRQYVPPSLYGC